MNKLTLEIKPKIGFGELNFGETSENIITYLGEAEEMEDIEDDDEFNTVILNYSNQGILAFFEGVEKSVLSCIETENENVSLFGKMIFEMNEAEITELMKENGFNEIETGVDEDGEKRLSFDDAMTDFFFIDDELVAVNWGVLINDQGEIEEI
ncbi:MAG: hypothetical protein K8R41_01895 [Bacteroidales bacterium]|nr:hypothetical protein [Bacteroidales bacterium]